MSTLTSYTATTRSALGVTMFLSATSTLILNVIKADTTFTTSQSLVTFLLFASYTALVFNLLASASWNLVNASLKRVRLEADGEGATDQRPSALTQLSQLGAGSKFEWLWNGCLAVTFVGAAFTATQVIAYVSLAEGVVMGTIFALAIIQAVVCLAVTCYY